MTCNIRLATVRDAELVAKISQLTFVESFAADNTPEDMELFLTQQFTRGRLMLEVGKPELDFLLAYVEDELAGYAKLRDGKAPAEIKGKALEIARLYANKAFIGKGVGAQLMAACIRMAEEKKKQWVWLGVWEHNQRAIAFYERWGFVKFGECDFLLGTDLQRDWLMKKELVY
jgi:ribosomal protein S18 acetylase RimI-like enzyme